MAADQEQFGQLLARLLSNENDIRTEAENVYDALPIETKVQYLLNSIRNGAAAEEVQHMAAVLLRRLFSNEFEEFYPNLPSDAKIQLKQELLVAIQQETNTSLRKKICDIAAELARNLIDDEGNNLWPEFLKFLFDCANSNIPSLKESSLQIFSIVPGIFGNQQNHYLDVIKQMLQQTLQDQVNRQVRFAAVRATSAFLLAHEKETTLHKHFADLLPHIIQGVSDTVQSQDDDTLFKCLIDLAESVPRYLRFNFDDMFQLCIKVLSDVNMSESWRHLALEVIVTLSETASAMVRKMGSKYIQVIVTNVLTMMVDVEDDPDWGVTDDIVEEDNDSNAVVGESALDRLACGLGGKTILQFIISSVPQMLSNQDWRYRHAALMAISAIGEGCHKQMESMLPQIMEGVLNFLQDSHPRVRYAACNAIGQMSSDFAPNFQKKFHDKVVPGLTLLMDDHVNPRVQAHAGAALVNFSECCPKQVLIQYLDDIISKLEMILSTKVKELIEKGTKLVLEQMVTTVASIADTAEEKFTAYYDRFMPCLKFIIQNATQPELRVLRGKTIECVSLIGLAVGKEKFSPDANDVMELLLKAQMSVGDIEDDDPQISYMISAWARICKVLGKQFEQYLPVVMGPVMKTALLKPEVALLDSDDMQAVEGDDDWQFVSLGEQQNFGIRTAGLEDKATACQMLVCYARELKEGFAEYTEQVVKLMVPMLKFYFHDGVRSASAESLPYLLECAQIKGPVYVSEMWNYICPELLKAMDTEPESEVLSDHMTSMAKCIETLGKGCLHDGHMKELIRILEKILKEHFEKADARQEKRKDEDYDEIVEESLLDEDDEDIFILSKVSDIIHSLFASHKELFFPYFDLIFSYFVKLLSPERPWPDHQWAICVFDDVIEHCGPSSIKYREYFIFPLLNFITDKSAEVRQAAAYGMGVMGQFAGEAFADACAEAIPRLVEVINSPDSRCLENVNSTENAIAAVTKILKYNGGCVNVDEIIPHWLMWLPVWEDEDEAPHVYGYLCDLIEGNHPAVLGANNSNLPRILGIIADVFTKGVLEEEDAVTKRLVNIARQIHGNSEVFQACVNQLSGDQNLVLHGILSFQLP